MAKFRVHIQVTEDRTYFVEANSPGAAESLVETELDTIPFKVTDREFSYTSAYQLKD